MKNTTFVPAALLCCGALFLAAPASADSHMEKSKDMKVEAKTAAMDPAMAQMMKDAQPGEQHKGMEALVGTWKATVKMMGGPGMEPSTSEGTMVNSMKFGGRVLEGKFNGTMMGAPMEGLSLMGFDNHKKEYWSFWTDNMSTTQMLSTGPVSSEAKTISMKGMADGPDGKPAEYITTTKIVSADTNVWTMSTMMGGKVVPWMEITYNRAK